MWLLNDVFLAFFKQEFTKKYIYLKQKHYLYSSSAELYET